MDSIVADQAAEYHARRSLKVADEVWIATALLHREHPERQDFSAKEVQERLQREHITGSARPGVQPHISLHCVANLPPNPGRYRMLFATAPSRRRLYRPADSYDRKRTGTKMTPDREDIPPKYRDLLDWYHTTYAGHDTPKRATDPLLALRGMGKDLWSDEAPDVYVRRLRKGWS